MPQLYSSGDLKRLASTSEETIEMLVAAGALHPLLLTKDGNCYFPEEELNILKGILRTVR